MAVWAQNGELERVRRRFRQEAEALLRATSSADSEYEVTEDRKKNEKPLPRVNVHSVFWILASIVLTYYVEFFKAVKECIQEGSSSFLLGSVLCIMCLSVALYCVIYLEWYCGIGDYDTKYPALVPITIITFIAAAVCYNITFWPVWSVFTPFLLFTQFMGMVMFISLLG
uniref:Transmembrane protein 128 n=1 Tax=Geotrypetes seraphini TaxID=260995 RepID=A0A6P8RID4_GEOSA|nr:transmembrane protein 128 [Geotrypetes seraphini]XP_033805128.1 transmembrane protein 128 [Geotrypetes seraphini]XP_033805138.1 transmembrane protein 128 [Geotrypetes seraphini]